MHHEAEHGWIADRVPYLMWQGEDTSPQPAVIYMTGSGGQKEEVQPWIVDRVTTSGMTLIAIDMPLHGERAPADYRPPSRVTIDDFARMGEEAVEDLRLTVDYVRNHPGVGGSRIGIRAISLSANFALAAIASGVPLRACLSICGSGNFAATGVFRMQRERLQPSEIEREVRTAAPRLAALDPIRNTSAFMQCALMMIHGVHDQNLPIDSHRILYDALAPYFIDHPEDLIFLIHAGKHGIRRPIEEIGWTWLIERLRSSPDPDPHPPQSNHLSG